MNDVFVVANPAGSMEEHRVKAVEHWAHYTFEKEGKLFLSPTHEQTFEISARVEHDGPLMPLTSVEFDYSSLDNAVKLLGAACTPEALRLRFLVGGVRYDVLSERIERDDGPFFTSEAGMPLFYFKSVEAGAGVDLSLFCKEIRDEIPEDAGNVVYHLVDERALH